MRTESLLLACALALAGCASAPRSVAVAPAESMPCASAGAAGRAMCDVPADVRAFVEDRDLCDHYRGEPWPSGESEGERTRRRELVEGIRTACAGTDRRLAELKTRYAADARIATLLGRFDPTIED